MRISMCHALPLGKQCFFKLLFVVFTINCFFTHTICHKYKYHHHANDSRPKEYNINLDLPEEDRWLNVLTDYKDLILSINKVMVQIFPKELLPLIEKVTGELDRYFPSPYAGEIRGIAKHLNISLGAVVMPNILYDISAYCTSIVAQNENGEIWHARNLDYKFTNVLRKLTVVVHFQRDSKTLYSGVTYVSLVGILTGQKPFKFSVSIDERRTGVENIWKNALVALLDRKALLISFVTRKTLEEAKTFTEAVVRLSNTDTIAPVYYIVAGVHRGEAAVLTKSRLSAVDVWFIDANNGRWYLVETNYDHWKAPPARDNRRKAAELMLNSTGRAGVNGSSLYKILSTPPLLRTVTTYTTVMCAAQPSMFKTCIRYYNATELGVQLLTGIL